MDEKKSNASRLVVEHTVLFGMPQLRADQEALILQGLHDLQFEFKDILQLSAGHVLTNDNFCTHALVVRFPSTESLVQYYKSQALANIAAKMIPFLHKEYTVDYMVSVTDDDNMVFHRKGSMVHITFLKVKEGMCLEAVEDMLDSLSAMAEGLDHVTQLTAGSNIYIRDKKYSHAFTAYLPSGEALEKLQKNPHYLAVLQEKVLPICSNVLSVNFLTYSQEQSSL